MNKLLHTPVHRIASRRTFSGGVRWSSYVGDIRCNHQDDNHPRKSLNHNFNSRNRRSFSSSSNISSAPHERLLVLGSGVAGCAAALTAARHGVPVTVLHAGNDRDDCNSYWAQGGVIYRNYRLREREDDGSESQRLVDTPLSLVNDIRIASGYASGLQRTSPLEETTYSSSHHLNTKSATTGQTCPTSGVRWNEDAAWKLACEGPSRVRELLLGSKDGGSGSTTGCVVPFDRTTLPVSGEDDDNDAFLDAPKKDGSEDDVLSLCLEASHAAPRIVHRADHTGRAITTEITQAAANHPLIEFVGDAVATDLIADEDEGLVIGARVLNRATNESRDCYAVHGVVLASGGLAGIYEHSTNPLGFNALGSSVGLALRLEDGLGHNNNNSNLRNSSNGGIVSDLEYVQFHPTALYLPNEARFLLTEALRGESAILRDAEGRAFAKDYHPNGELAPRDIVARAVFMESQKAAADEHNAFLDITHRDATWLKDRFPTIHKHLKSRDNPMDFTKEVIPVTPAAHYTCGGVTTDLNGRVVGNGHSGDGTSGWYRNLYAAGEAARTGLHGGNRLASTSLLEGLVFGASVGETVAGAVGDNADAAALEDRELVTETMHKARHAIEQRLVMGQDRPTGAAPVDEGASREAAAVLARLKSLMWDNVGVVRTPAKLALAVSELTAIRDEADRLWEGDGRGRAGWEASALRDAAYAGLAVADAALANPVSGGAHYVAASEDEQEGGSSDSDNEDECHVAARA